MKKHALFFCMLGASLVFYSCEPDTPVQPINNLSDKNPANPVNDTIPKIKHLQAKNWRLTGLTMGAPGFPAQSDIYNAGYPNCQKDDLYKFTTPNILLVETGQAKCGSNDTGKNGTWELNNNSSILTIAIPSQTLIGMTGTFGVIELTSTKMVLRQTVNGSEYTLTFKAQ